MWVILRYALIFIVLVWVITDPAGFGESVAEAGSIVGDVASNALDGK